jgi:hypothetical protein
MALQDNTSEGSKSLKIPIDMRVTIGKSTEGFSFTKLTMCVIFILFTIGAILGGVLVIVSAAHDISLGLQIDTGMFIAYATYLGAPTATAVGFYAWKSKAENILKIQKSTVLPDDMPSVLANMKGGD